MRSPTANRRFRRAARLDGAHHDAAFGRIRERCALEAWMHGARVRRVARTAACARRRRW